MLDRLAATAPLVDPFGRAITYIRVSVTDRCDFRCVYCMSENMHFLPKRDLLTLEELDRLASAFVAKGTRKVRITGGEPLVRRDIMRLFQSLLRHLGSGALEELKVTSNGSQLDRYAGELVRCGVRRINVSLDTLDAAKFHVITRWGELGTALRKLGYKRERRWHGGAGFRALWYPPGHQHPNEQDRDAAVRAARETVVCKPPRR